MSSKKPKFYVVWKGHQTGIFENWEQCKKQIDNYPGAQYKSYETKATAEYAFQQKPEKMLYAKTAPKPTANQSKSQIIQESIAVDGACSGKTGLAEYQGVYVKTGERLFHQGPFPNGTNNLMEFLAIVHALAYCKQKNINMPIYTDSKTAMSWIKKKKANTTHGRDAGNKQIFDLVDRAELWLQTNAVSLPLLKWETDQWGEIPADFNRK